MVTLSIVCVFVSVHQSVPERKGGRIVFFFFFFFFTIFRRLSKLVILGQRSRSGWRQYYFFFISRKVLNLQMSHSWHTPKIMVICYRSGRVCDFWMLLIVVAIAVLISFVIENFKIENIFIFVLKCFKYAAFVYFVLFVCNSVIWMSHINSS